MDNQFDMFGGLPTPPAPEQFKLVQMQVFNWGTFSNLVTIAIAEKGFLFVGPSGSGKSTLLDAHATLTTPPKWVGFNLAAREGESGGHGTDRNLMTYVRGAWAQQTGKSGEATQQYLREGTTWSALAETYRSCNRTVTIVQVFWVRGKTTDRKEVKRTYLVVDRAFDIQELQPFADKDFDLKMVRAIPGVHVHEEFSGYGERFRRYVGIEQESSMRLLHKTQSAKNLGDINDFLRDFTLEPPQTFEIAKQLVDHFQALREAHATVVDTRRQIEVLTPARVAYEELLAHRVAMAELVQTRENLDSYKEQLKSKLLKAMVAGLAADVESNNEKAAYWRDQESQSKAKLVLLMGKRDGNAVAQIAKCEAELTIARNLLRGVEGTQVVVTAACGELDRALPESENDLLDLQLRARRHLVEMKARDSEAQAEREELRLDLREAQMKLRHVQTELAELARRRSNIPSQLLNVRNRICEALGVDESELPFAGELVDVKDSEQAWKGAAERVMNSFAKHILVPGVYFAKAKRFVNENHLGAQVNMYRTEHVGTGFAKPGSLASKLVYMDHALADWTRSKSCDLFDHQCVDSVDDFDTYRRAVTREGLVKSDASSLRKDDRYRVDDRSQWILGGDTRAKVASLQDALEVLNARVAELNTWIAALSSSPEKVELTRQMEKLMELSWAQVNLKSAQQQFEVAQQQLDTAKMALPDVEALEALISEEETNHSSSQKEASRLEASALNLEEAIRAYSVRLAKLDAALLAKELTEEVIAELTTRFDAFAPRLEMDNLEQVAGQVKDALNKEERAVQAQLSNSLHAMTTQFREYIRDWPLKAANLDATEGSAPEFFEMLHQLEVDGLPQYEERFLNLLHEQGTQEMMRLQVQLENERRDIRTRMEAVNASLKTTAFNKGTHLVIEPKEKSIPEVMAFRQNLKEAYGNYLQGSTPADIEKRFTALNEIVKRLESQEAPAKAWRELCLDVRRHVEFIIREINEQGEELEVYRSGAGKSGGQRQKLTATILAAALRYQLGGKETGMPKFSTVFMDEAFDKADSEFTDLAMKVFETFGFQLVVATPMKSVMTLEPYIGGAGYVHIEERKHSRVVHVAYKDEEKKLDFGAFGVSNEADEDI